MIINSFVFLRLPSSSILSLSSEDEFRALAPRLHCRNPHLHFSSGYMPTGGNLNHGEVCSGFGLGLGEVSAGRLSTNFVKIGISVALLFQEGPLLQALPATSH